ncbi:MAG: enoyl-CoA hydratase/isomerase family protein, partial [Deltaproteobacteria bacterium]|nr:enoyl-CoA hydratase/isomerase family protein [Deltaproteobacteria bacterium]
EHAKFGQPEVKLGLVPGCGGTQRLPRLIGKGRALQLILSGGVISAQEAKAIGMVNKVFPADKLWEETMKTAGLIASKGKVALRSVKQCIDRGCDVDLRRGCQMEIDHFGLCMSSPDAKEGLSAFLEKRKPSFKAELD